MERKVTSTLKAFKDSQSGKWGIINEDGEPVIPFLYNNPSYPWEDAVFLFKENGQEIYKNRYGKVIPPHLWKTMNTFHEGLVTIIDETDHYGFADEEGQLVFPPQWDYAFYFENGYAYIREGENRYYMDHEGQKLPIREKLPKPASANSGLDYIQRMYLKTVAPASKILQENNEKEK